MRAVLLWVGLTLAAALGAAIVFGYERSRAGSDCKALTARADISARAAELCTGEIMACQMTFEQVQSVLADRQRAEEACK